MGQDGHVTDEAATLAQGPADPARPGQPTESGQPPEPGSADRTPHRRMRRVPQGRWLAGVCTGIAEHLGVDVRYVRAVMAALGVFGVGVGGYLFLWALVPQRLEPGEPPVGRLIDPFDAQDDSRSRRRHSVILLAFGLLVLFLGANTVSGFDSWFAVV